MDDTQRMWLAGLLDSEGHVRATKPMTTTSGTSAGVACQLMVGSSDRDVIDRAREWAACGTVTTRKPMEGRKRMFVWTVTRQADFLRMCREVGPLLTEPKLRQVNMARAQMYEHKTATARKYEGTGRHSASDPADWAGDITPSWPDGDRAAWAAGMIEGDGTFGWVDSKNGPDPHITVQVNDEGAVMRLREWTGAGTLASRVKDGRAVWSWRVSSQGGFRDVCAQVGPLLLRRRTEAMAATLTALDAYQEAARRKKQFCPRGHDKDMHGRTARNGCKQCARLREQSHRTGRSMDELLAAERDGVI